MKVIPLIVRCTAYRDAILKDRRRIIELFPSNRKSSSRNRVGRVELLDVKIMV